MQNLEIELTNKENAMDFSLFSQCVQCHFGLLDRIQWIGCVLKGDEILSTNRFLPYISHALDVYGYVNIQSNDAEIHPDIMDVFADKLYSLNVVNCHAKVPTWIIKDRPHSFPANLSVDCNGNFCRNGYYIGHVSENIRALKSRSSSYADCREELDILPVSSSYADCREELDMLPVANTASYPDCREELDMLPVANTASLSANKENFLVLFSDHGNFKNILSQTVGSGVKICILNVGPLDDVPGILKHCKSLGYRSVQQESSSKYDVIVKGCRHSNYAHGCNFAIKNLSFEHLGFLYHRNFIFLIDNNIGFSLPNVKKCLDRFQIIHENSFFAIQSETWFRLGGFNEFLEGTNCFSDIRKRLMNDFNREGYQSQEAESYHRQFGRKGNWGKLPGQTNLTTCESQPSDIRLHFVKEKRRYDAVMLKGTAFDLGYCADLMFVDGEFVTWWIADKTHDFAKPYNTIEADGILNMKYNDIKKIIKERASETR